MADRVFQLSQWATVQPPGGWQIGAGPFTGSGRDDLFAYQPSNGSLWVRPNTGGGFAIADAWATVSPTTGWQFTVGDFTGDGLADVAGYHPGNGSVWVGLNRGSSFEFHQWAILAPATGWWIGSGFFTGSGRADLLAYHDPTGTLWVGRNTGSAFTFSGTWAAVDAGRGWQFAAEDFIGDGLSDVVGYDPTDGSLWVGQNISSSFRLTRWATTNPAAGWQIDPGRFTGRAKADVLAYYPGTGGLWVGENTGQAFTFTETSAVLDPPGGWQIVAGTVNGDQWDDVVGYQPADGSIWVGESSLRPIEGYCWPLSAAPGEEIGFRLSGQGPSTATVARHSSTSDTVDSQTVRTLSFTATRQPTPDAPFRTGCGWTDTFTLTVPQDWTSGIYSAACADAAETSCDITFVVKPAPQQRAQVAVLANANTWLAYNGWGGQSKYTGLARTSFLRPMPAAASDGDMTQARGELWFLGWLESQGVPYDVYTDLDFHNDGCDPAQYRLLMFGTHPEYWSEQEYDNLGAYLDAGGSAAYLGGNGVFEVGTYDADQTVMVFRNGIEGGPREDALFRALGRPELAILGVATERCSVVGSPYVVRAAEHPLFAGTGVHDGDLFGTSGLNLYFGNGQAAGIEVDTSRGQGATGMPTNCLLDPRVISPAGFPESLVVLAQGQPDASGPGADMTYYEHPGGGCMFSVGSISFGGSLVTDPVLSGIMRNLLTRAGIP